MLRNKSPEFVAHFIAFLTFVALAKQIAAKCSGINTILLKIAVYFKQNIFFLLGILIVVWVVIANFFPEGYVISSTDISQIINVRENFLEYFVRNPSFLLYLCFLYVLEFFSISPSVQLSFHLGLFLLGSYLSFHFFTRLFFRSEDFLASAISLFYALNLFTLFTFSMHSLGYTSFFLLYIFIPALIGLFIKFVLTRKRHFLLGLVLILFFSSSGFGNPAFVLSLAMVFVLCLVGLLVLEKVKMSRALLANLGLLAALALLVSAFWLLPLLPKVQSGVEGLNTTNPTDLISALTRTASPVMNTLSLNHYSYDFFPFNFPYPKLVFLQNFFVVASFLPILIVVAYFSFAGKINRKKLFTLSLILMAFLIVLIGRLTPPFEIINYFVFVKIWGFNTLRAFDKFGIFFPFFLSLALLLAMKDLWKTKARLIGLVLLIAMLIVPLPFFLGKLQQNMSIRYSNLSPEKKDYRTAKLTFLVKIPDDYYRVKSIINQKGSDNFVATLPHTLGDSGTGSSSYPKWKLNGVDITQRLYRKRFIEANVSYFSGWYFVQEFGHDQRADYGWIAKLLGMMNARFIIYHKDASDSSIKRTQSKMDQLERDKYIKKVDDNEYFTLYEINEELIFPLITFQEKRVGFVKDPAWIERNTEKIQEMSRKIPFQKIGHQQFAVDLGNIKDFEGAVILAEEFDPLWKAYAIKSNGSSSELENHFLARGYANGWELKNISEIEKVIIEYYPIRLMWWGMVISGATILFLAVYLLRYYYVKRKMVKN